MTNPRAIILDCEGAKLSADERRFFAEVNPYGYILFGRNCVDPAQIKALTAELKAISGRDDVPILIDQEGGRVARLRPPHWRASYPAAQLAALGENAHAAVRLNARLIAEELRDLGINVDCAPVADLPVPGAHDIIGDRAYGATPQQVIEFAAEMAAGLLERGVIPVVKHIPGHGRAQADSHHALPVVDASLETLRATDFAPFRALTHIPMAMTAHVLYTALDAERPATLSPAVITEIRDEIDYDGLLMSDDLTMKALSGTIESRITGALQAGCDVVLYCNGITTLTLEEKRAALDVTPPMTKSAYTRHVRAFAAAREAFLAAPPLDVAATEAHLTAFIRRAA